MKQVRRAEITLAATLLALACSPNAHDSSADRPPTGVARQSLGDASWYVTGRSTVDQDGYASYTPLPDGTVLIADSVRGAELYDPRSGLLTSVETGPSGFSQRDRGVLLRNGIVAFFGAPPPEGAAGVQFYDPATRTFSLGPDCDAECGEAALLRNGNVLVQIYAGYTGDLREFDVATRTFGALTRIDSTSSTLTLLPSGKVLVAQRIDTLGEGQPALLFDPDTSELEETGSMLGTCAGGPRALLPDGRVLFCCNVDADTDELSPACEYYDPEAGEFVEGPSRAGLRSDGAMAVLPSGEVMILGGYSPAGGNYEELRTTELLEVGASEFTPAPSMGFARQNPSVHVLPSGKLLVGGHGPIETYDPGIFSQSATPRESKYSLWNVAVPLPDGRVFLGGDDAASIYDPLADVIETLGLHCNGSAALLPDGRVLVVNGRDEPHAQIIDPESGQSEEIPGNRCDWCNLVSLPSGAVLEVGGTEYGPEIPTADLFEPAKNRFLPLQSPSTTTQQSALLGSGKVVLAGSLPNDSLSPTASSELFDPARQAFDSLDETLPALSVLDVSLPLASGDALFGTRNGWYRFDAKTEAFESLQESVEVGPGAALLTGDRLFCGRTTCSRYEQIGGRFVETFTAVAGGGSDMVSSGTGIVVMPSNADYGSLVRFWPFPPDAVRPVLDPVTNRLVSGRPVRLTGSRFTRPSAVGAQTMPSLDRHPLVAFMPVSGGGPEFSLVTEWTDTTLTWIAPTTTFRGAGWVHVFVDGVPSLGRFTFLDAAPAGVRCASANECGSGYCSEGVCCDGPCNEGCKSCLAENQGPGGTDGTCANVREGVDPKQICTDSLCGESGRCDGQGECVVSGEARSCSPYLCRDSTCLTTCNGGSDCAPGYSCTTGACGRCSSDGEGIARGSGTFSCAPYRCDRGQCQTSCDSRDDCAPNHRCDQGECVPSAEFEQAVDPGACSATQRQSRSSSLPWLVPLFGWLVRRRLGTRRARGAAA